MARVDFYVLNQAGPQSRHSFACRLAEKAYRLEHTVHILAGTRADADRIDELLWTFRDGSFVPHHRLGNAAGDMNSPITIGTETDTIEPRDLLINLCDEVPDFAGAFPRVAELVTSDAECKQLGRKRFAEYRDRGHTLESHNV
jgi:DNA polymerase-3 subunit chi